MSSSSVRTPYHLPPGKQKKLNKAKKLEWATIGFMISIIVLLFFTLGNSQAMKTAWIEDILSLIPPIAFLVAVRFRTKPPDEKFPYGYRRVLSIAFLCAALALAFFGVYLLYDSVIALVKREHPTIGTVQIFGWQVWLGWLMIAALIYSVIPPVILGYMKLPLARKLHEKVLYADADMNKADWLTGLAAILGILGIGIGWWWADAVAAIVISFDVSKDGFTNLKNAVFDLMDRRPMEVGKDKEDTIREQLQEKIEKLDWVEQASVRLREEGDVLNGEAYVVFKDENHLLDKLEQVYDAIANSDWRLYDVPVVPVRSLKAEQNGEE